jgi:hypothetical protein
VANEYANGTPRAVAKSSQPKSKSPVEVAAELREEREKRATQARSDLIAHFGGDADPAATMQALAGEIQRVRHAMSQIVEPGCRSRARPSNVAADGVRVRIVKER